MATKKVTLAVDSKFFKEIFEKERRRIQEEIGIGNLSQPNFTKMIQGFKIRRPDMNLSQVNTKVNFGGRKRKKW